MVWTPSASCATKRTSRRLEITYTDKRAVRAVTGRGAHTWRKPSCGIPLVPWRLVYGMIKSIINSGCQVAQRYGGFRAKHLNKISLGYREGEWLAVKGYGYTGHGFQFPNRLGTSMTISGTYVISASIPIMTIRNGEINLMISES